MKIGDSVDVVVAGQVVAKAEIKEVGDGTATLIVPATRVVMATRTELSAETPSSEPSTEVIVDEVVRQGPDGTETPVQPAQNASEAVGATQNPASTEADKVISSSSVPQASHPDPNLVAAIAAALAAAKPETPAAEVASDDSTPDQS